MEIDRDEIRKIVEQVLAKMTVPAAQAAPVAAAPPPSPAPGGIPVEASGRHVHLTAAAFETLFGPGAVLGQTRLLSQPGEFLSDKRVTLAGPKGVIENVAVLGPLRKLVQAELSVTDSKVLGVNPPLNLSGDLSGAAAVDITGPAGTLRAQNAAIIAKNHIHLRPQDARQYNVKNGELLSVRVKTARPVVFENVTVRVRDDFMPAMHIDFDEANACMLGACGSVFAEILGKGAAKTSPQARGAKPYLVTEMEAKQLAATSGDEKRIQLPKGSILTPSAKDVFLHAHCQVEFE